MKIGTKKVWHSNIMNNIANNETDEIGSGHRHQYTIICLSLTKDRPCNLDHKLTPAQPYLFTVAGMYSYGCKLLPLPTEYYRCVVRG